MSGVDIFIAILCAVIFFGGLYLNFVSRKLTEQYAQAHKIESTASNSLVSKNKKVQKKNE